MMLKKSSSKKRKNSNIASALFGLIALGIIFLACPYGAGAAPEVVYKPARPQKNLEALKDSLPPPIDLKTLPDPFLSYLVRQGRDEAARRELEKQKQLEEAQKRKQAELKLADMKAAAAERLRRLKEPRTELQKLNLAQLTLTAIIQDGSKAWAMVRDEKGMGYILKKGTAIGTNGGRVAKISGIQKKIIINEPYLEKELHIKYKPKVIELPDEVFE
jgi:Tfp pilus assembly protein PilP